MNSTSTPESSEQQNTRGVQTLLGDPKKAIIKLAIPMIIAMSLQTVYNLVDALWVSGFGADFFTATSETETGSLALAAIGFALPFFMMAIAISTGVGVGTSSAISRKIGAKDKQGADNIAVHSIIVTLIIAGIFTLILLSFLEPIMTWMGASASLQLALEYGRIIFAGSILIFFVNVALAILRGEGDATRVMYAMVFGAALNIVLDPFFIFTFGLGVAGAAYATVLSMLVTTLILIYWLFFKKNTYVNLSFKKFRFKAEVLYDIFRVGLPASFQQLSMSVTMILVFRIIVDLAQAGDYGIAVYSTGWRVVTIAVLPLLGLATAIVSVTGAAYGAKDGQKLSTGFFYAVKFGLVLELIVALFVFVLAPWITLMFTTGEGAENIATDLERFIKISCFFYPGAAFGIASSAMFQGVGKGLYSLIATLLRTIILTPILAVVFCCFFSMQLDGVWWGIVCANLLGSLTSFTWSNIHIAHVKTTFS